MAPLPPGTACLRAAHGGEPRAGAAPLRGRPRRRAGVRTGPCRPGGRLPRPRRPGPRRPGRRPGAGLGRGAARGGARSGPRLGACFTRRNLGALRGPPGGAASPRAGPCPQRQQLPRPQVVQLGPDRLRPSRAGARAGANRRDHGPPVHLRGLQPRLPLPPRGTERRGPRGRPTAAGDRRRRHARAPAPRPRAGRARPDGRGHRGPGKERTASTLAPWSRCRRSPS